MTEVLSRGQHGALDLSHYRGAALTDPVTHAIAARVRVEADDNPDPNSLVPQTVTVRLRDGTVHNWHCAAMLAAPSRPLTRDRHLAKFRRCWDFAAVPLPERNREALIELVNRVEEIGDVRDIATLLVPDANEGPKSDA